MKKSLSAKARRFVAEYSVDRNATQAAIRAGYSRRTAGQQGNRLLRNVQIRKALQAAEKKAADRAEVSAAYVLASLKIEAQRTGKGASHGARVRALELLGRHVNLFPERHEHEGGVRLILTEEIVDAHSDVRENDPTPSGASEV